MSYCYEEISKVGITTEQYEECLRVLIDKKIDKVSDLDWKEICELYNLQIGRAHV